MAITPEEIKQVKAQGCLFNNNKETFSVRVITRNGVLNWEEMQKIAEASHLYGNGNTAITVRMTVEIQGVLYDNIEALKSFLAEAGLEIGGTGAKVRPIVCCKGTVCVYGHIDTQGIALELHERYYKGYKDVKLPHKFKIAVGGCANNCIKPNLNDVGIMGQYAPNFLEELCRGCKKCGVIAACPMGAPSVVDGKLLIDPKICVSCGRCVGKCYFDSIPDGKVGYRVFIGGRWGKKTRIADMLPRIFNREEAVDMVGKVLSYYQEHGNHVERVAEMVDRLGAENVINDLIK